jgi:hypothetical protein
MEAVGTGQAAPHIWDSTFLRNGSPVRIVGAYQELDGESLFHFGLMF